MPYDDLEFRGRYMQRERARVEKERLVSAAFNAWLQLSAQAGKKAPSWRKYAKALGLIDEAPVSKEELKREADRAMEKVNDIIKKAQAAGVDNGSR